MLRKLGQLKPDSQLSHYKAISLALRNCLSRAAADPLAKLLNQPGFTGHATLAPITKRRDKDGKESAAAANRFITTADDEQANGTNLNKAYRELIVAAMLYRCGDKDGMAEAILRLYAMDLHGHFASYAQRTRDGGWFSPRS